jgi:Arc/MetJ-type ribon-helix-helix transcriptional regulator
VSEPVAIQVSPATRDHVNRLAAESGNSADTVIRNALRLAEREIRRERAAIEAAQVAADPADRAEVRAAIREAVGD